MMRIKVDASLLDEFAKAPHAPGLDTPQRAEFGEGNPELPVRPRLDRLRPTL